MRSDLSAASRMRRATASLVAAALMAAGAVIAIGTQALAAPGCRVSYQESGWSTGFVVWIGITNSGDEQWNGWELKFRYEGNERLVNGFSGTWSQDGQNITVRNPVWLSVVSPGQSVSTGAQFSFSGSRVTPPLSFTVNGVVCNQVPLPTGPVSGPSGPTTGPSGPVTGPSGATGPLTGPSGPSGPVDPRVNNPYQGVNAYVNPEWSANAAAEPGGTAVSNQPTFVWLDSIASIAGSSTRRGLRDHLDGALAQQAGVIGLSIYNLPGRECTKYHPTGELGPNEIDRYRTEFIDPIAAILADPKYRSLRIVTVVEVDALSNLISHTAPRSAATPACDTMKNNGNYVAGIGYALAKFGAISNVYNYLDAAHHAALGWDDYMAPAVQLFREAASAAGSTPAKVDGFIVNAQNYGATVEPFLTINDVVNGTSVRQSRWVDWNNFVDEQSYSQVLRQGAVNIGFSSSIGILIDTSRNGWGGPNRPTAKSTAADLDTYVNQSRIDRRVSAELNWCNQVGAGLGERPRAASSDGLDAYVWFKPPGESDGAGDRASAVWEPMCDPDYGGSGSTFRPNGAMRDAPPRTQWFSAYFRQLLANAYPPLG